ncbi:MAG TPA: AAA family ATPase [Flavobacteriaceae bacterium]|nr:AAA family ATPase [Flavobacteriaceae bacterium]|tara:strand:- start:49721 stop:51010 length:1290 start_codon:yes stop_codon:yes gene_type:complete
MYPSSTPLAERMRPKSLSDYEGQEHLVGKNGALFQSIQSGFIPSMILWGPPGTGKTTLAKLLAGEKKRPFYKLSAINAGVKEVRDIIQKAQNQGGLFTDKNPLLFIDEIHRFSKSQQDALLGAVEKGIITLIGATTENPSFEVINALLSRCQVFTLKPLTLDNLKSLLNRALKKDSFLQSQKIVLEDPEALIHFSSGDARKLLTLLELVIFSFEPEEKIIVTNEKIKNTLQTNAVQFDKDGDFHYDVISAFIKSIRGSDPNAAVYWLARMLQAGEDVKFIARRMLIAASEDIGNANPNALVLAQTTFSSVQIIGLPEARILLSQCAVYLATSAKSNASYLAINKAQEQVENNPNLGVPLHLRNAPTALSKEMGHGLKYQYPHDHPNHFVEEGYLPEELEGTRFYEPGDNPKENTIRQWLKKLWGKKYGY